MAQVKYASALISVAAGGSATSAVLGGADINTYDDFQDRRITGIFVGISTALLRARVVVAGSQKTDIDLSAFNATQGFLPVNSVVRTGQYFHVDIASFIAGATNNIPVVLRYEVPD